MATQDQPTQPKPSKNNKNLVIFEIVLAVLVLAGITVLINWHKWFGYTSYTAETPQKAKIVKVVRTYKDLMSGTDLMQDHSRKKMVVTEIPPGVEILSIVSNVTEVFALPGTEGVHTTGLFIEQNGKEISSGDLAALPNLASIGFENHRQNLAEFSLYSLTAPVNLMLAVEADANANLDKLKSGIVEFYITEVTP